MFFVFTSAKSPLPLFAKEGGIWGITVFKSYIDMRLPVLPITVVLSLLVAFVAVIIPTRRALSINVANVLKGE